MSTMLPGSPETKAKVQARLAEARLEIRTDTRRMKQLCRRCDKIAEATQVLTWHRNHMVADRSTCDTCGSVLWDWTWESTMIAAQEARAALHGVTVEPVPVCTPPTGQMDLF